MVIGWVRYWDPLVRLPRNQDLVTLAVLSSAHWRVSMLRPILFVWVLILVPKTCLWAQDTSPGNAQGCDPRELTEALLRPTDPAYAESIELTRELENRGYIVRCVLGSKMVSTFEGQLGAALYRTSRGDFEALFLPKPHTFASPALSNARISAYTTCIRTLLKEPHGLRSQKERQALRSHLTAPGALSFLGEQIDFS